MALVPWGLSFAAHAALIALAFFVVWSVTTPRQPAGPPAVVSFFDPAPIDLSLSEPESEEPARDQEPTEDALPEPAAPDLPSPEAILEEALGPPIEADRPAPPEDLSELMYVRRFPEVEFFGVGSGDAQSIVYVVDGSGSMISIFPLLKRELAASIRELAPTQRFQVVFFQGDGDALAAPHRMQLIQATRSNIRAVLEWIEGVRPRGRSNPLPALELAVKLEPDAVFLLSNTITGAGEWEVDEQAILARLDTLNPADSRTGFRPVTIKTIEFLRDDPSGLLRTIGRLHGGPDGYVFIGRNDLGRQ